MYRILTGFLLLVPLPALADDKPAAEKPGPKVGDDLPGSFLPFNVTGPNKGRFHSLVTDNDLDPVVVLFVRDLEVTDTLKDLLKQLDEQITKNPAARLHAFAVFVSNELPDVLADDDKREVVAKRLEDLGNGLGLKELVVCLDDPKDVEKYASGDAWATALLYRQFRIVAIDPLPKTDAKPAEDKILADVREKLKPKR